MSYLDHLSTETLAEHAEGLLVDAEAAQVEAHLRGCADCRAEELLLASLQDILAADDPGPMPAHYAARIDAALAEVAMTDPLRGSFHSDSAAPVGAGAGTQSGAATAQGGATDVGSAPVVGAQVIDMASRRRTVAAGFRRVSTVAASVVLLIGGAALGAQVLNSDPIVRDPVAGDVAIPSAQPSADRYALRDAPADARNGPGGSKIDDRTGIVYQRDGTNLYPDGTVVRPPKKPGDDPRVIPSPNAVVLPPGIGITPDERPGQGPATGLGPDGRPGIAATDEPSAPSEQPEIQPTPKQGDPADVSTAAPPNETRAAGPQAVQAEPYVAQSGDAYNPQNFATKVVDLLQDAGVRYEASSTGEAQVEPSERPSNGDTGGDSSGSGQSDSTEDVSQDMVPASFSAASTAAAKPGDRGPADKATQNRVARCGDQLGVQVLAADVGFWKGQQATILVVPNTNDERQVIGYVLYGPCTDEQPASAADAEWEQPVQKPGAPEGPVEQPAETASPTREP